MQLSGKYIPNQIYVEYLKECTCFDEGFSKWTTRNTCTNDDTKT